KSATPRLRKAARPQRLLETRDIVELRLRPGLVARAIRRPRARTRERRLFCANGYAAPFARAKLPAMANPRTPLLLRRAAAETALFLAAGVFLSVLGPFDTHRLNWLVRAIYWPTVIVGGGVIGIAVDRLVMRRIHGFWTRLVASSLLMTPFVTALVWAVSGVMFWRPGDHPDLAPLVFQVFVISFGVMGLRQLAWRSVWTERAASDAQAEPIDPSSAFRQRLSARRRAARLLAVEAEDHYLRVHTDAGDELITLRFSDALI